MDNDGEQQQGILDAVAQRVGKIPEYVGAAFVALSSLAGVFVGLANGTARAVWITCAVVLVVMFLAIAFFRERLRGLRKTKDDKDTRALKARVAELEQQLVDEAAGFADEYEADLAWIMKDRLANPLHLVAEMFAELSKTERVAKAKVARMAILSTTTDVVGRAAQRGTRANLFVIKEDGDGGVCMEPDPVSYGRSDRSTRIFRNGSPTLEATLAGKSRFVENTSSVDDETGAALEYETYLTHPVREGTGTIYGALTVDCKNSGELVERTDTAMMSVLSVMIAMTYRAESLRPPAGTAR